MDFNTLENYTYCKEIVDGVSEMLNYSHIPTILISLLIGLYVFFNNRKSLVAKILLGITVSFSLWTGLNLIIWDFFYQSNLVMFVWSLLGIFDVLLFILCLYFVYVFIDKRDVTFTQKSIFTVLLLPAILFTPTTLNLEGFDLSECISIENTHFLTYIFFVEILISIWIMSLVFFRYIKSQGDDRKQILILGVGITLFLLSFFTAGYLSDYLGDFQYELYGMAGMIVFLGILAYLIVKFKALNIKLLGAQALVVALWFLIGSLLFVAQSTQTKVVAGVTLFLAIIGGYFLVRSVKKEVAQREEIAKLAETLAKANDRLKVLDKLKSEFVSIASHQLRSPLTAVRGYASMLVEGSYGKLPEKALEAATNIADSAKYMALSVEDYLNVSRIEAGNMKYEVSDFNLKDTAEKIVDELRPVALKKGLVMVFRSECSGSCSVHADIGKTRQVIMNLLDNSMKYTPKGTITVVAHDDVKKKKMYVSIQDTGVGMSKETQEEVFDKFVRAKNANNVNTTGTGLGLFVAKKMVTDMGGKVWAESEGEGKGSTFHIELPLLPGKSTR